MGLLTVITASLSVSGFLVWQLYFFGYYTRTALLVLLGVFALAGLYGLRAVDPDHVVSTLARGWAGTSFPEKLLLLFSTVFLEALLESSAGLPYVAWDAVVSWDKWALDMASRKALGGYLMGGYPQFYSAINSIFYKTASTPNLPLPPEQLLLHGFQTIYPAILALSLWSLGRRFRFPGLLAFALFVSLPAVAPYLSNGYADLPLTAFLASAFALADGCARTWSPHRTRQTPDAIARAVVLLVFLFPCAFTKGTGAIWILVLAIGLLLQDWRATRFPVAIALLMVLTTTFPYLSLQNWLTDNPVCAEKNPFLHSFPVVYAHVSIFKPDFPHLIDSFRSLFATKNAIVSYPPWLEIALTGLILFLTLLHRKTRPFAVVSFLALVFWFYTASYDLRNAFPALCLAACGVAALPYSNRIRRAAGWRGVYPYALSLLLAAALLPLLANSALPYLKSQANRYHLPRCVSDPAELKHMAFRPEGDLRNILFEAPYGRRAVHIVAGTHLYRLLAPKGVYGIQQNSYNDSRPYDIVIQNKGMADPPPPFLPVARLKRAAGYTVLWMNKPPFAPARFTPRPSDAPSEPAARPSGDPSGTVLLPPGTTVELEWTPPPGPRSVPGEGKEGSEDHPAEIRDGIISVEVSSLENDVEIGLVEEDLLRDPFHGYVTPYRDPQSNRIRILYWMRDEGPAVPRLRISTGTVPLEIRSVSLSRPLY